MGLDFVSTCTPSFERSWDRGRAELAQPDLFANQVDLKDRTWLAVAEANCCFKERAEYMLRLEVTRILIQEGTEIVGQLREPGLGLVAALRDGAGVAVGTVQKVLLSGRAAELSVA